MADREEGPARRVNRVGVLLAVVGFAALFLGVFAPTGGSACSELGVPCTSPRLAEILTFSGLLMLLIGFGVLFRSGWRGSVASSALAAVAVLPAVWFLYEVARQSGCQLIGDAEVQRTCLVSFGEMTAPVLSSTIGLLVFVAGWLRWRRLRVG